MHPHAHEMLALPEADMDVHLVATHLLWHPETPWKLPLCVLLKDMHRDGALGFFSPLPGESRPIDLRDGFTERALGSDTGRTW